MTTLPGNTTESETEATNIPSSTPGGHSRSPERTHRVRRSVSVWVVVAVVLLAAVAGFAAYHILAASKGSSSGNACTSQCHSLVVWAYDGIFGGGSSPGAARGAVFQQFGNLTGSTVTVVSVSGNLAQALINAKPGTLPDVVMGLDELEAPEADQAGLLIPYTSPQLAHVNPAVVSTIAPDHSVTPYEYGYLGLDYNISTDSSLGHPFSQGDFFQALQANPSLAKNLYYPDPVQGDITGEEFLAWEVEYYTNVLHQNWTTFWTSVAPDIHPLPDWSTCWSEFTSGVAPTCLSYISDPAAEAYFGAGGWMNTSVAQHGGKNWSWMTVYGTGIVKGGVHNLTLAQDFIDWTLGGTVQREVPTNEWMEPANNTVSMPGVYNWTLPLSSVSAVNQFTTPSQSSSEMTSWVLQLEAIVF